MSWLDIDEGLTISTDHIVAIQDDGNFGTLIFVAFGNEGKSFTKNVPFSTMKGILNGRGESRESQIQSSVARNLEQLAKYQTIQVP